MPGRGISTRDLALLLAAAASLTLLAWLVLVLLLRVAHVWYGFHELADGLVYIGYAESVARGDWPYGDFPFEYPPLALLLFLLPPRGGGLGAYEDWFSAMMIALCVAAAVITTATAVAYWRRLERGLATAVAFAALVLASGAIAANKYDVAVALVVAVTLLLLAHSHTTWAGATLGLGFALKMTPVILLPLVLLLGKGRRIPVWSLLAFAIATAVPFVPFILHGPTGLGYPFIYHGDRPLQVESVLSTPYLVATLVGDPRIEILRNYGSQNLLATGTELIAAASPWLALIGLALVYFLAWRRREGLRASPELVSGAGLAVVLVFICCSKVLSPQFLVWTLPVVALALVSGRRWEQTAGGLTAVAMLLTQVEFPDLYWRVVDLEPGPVALVVVRNLVLVLAAGAAVGALWRLPASGETAAAGRVAAKGEPDSLESPPSATS